MKEPAELAIVIETPRGSNAKYAWDRVLVVPGESRVFGDVRDLDGLSRPPNQEVISESTAGEVTVVAGHDAALRHACQHAPPQETHGYETNELERPVRN